MLGATCHRTKGLPHDKWRHYLLIYSSIYLSRYPFHTKLQHTPAHTQTYMSVLVNVCVLCFSVFLCQWIYPLTPNLEESELALSAHKIDFFNSLSTQPTGMCTVLW